MKTFTPLFWWIIVALLSLGVALEAFAMGSRLTEETTLSKLSSFKDGSRVAFTAWGRSCRTLRGIRGSQYLSWIVGDGDEEIQVFSYFPVPHCGSGEFFIIGTYHSSGRFGGQLAKRHIVASYVDRELN